MRWKFWIGGIVLGAMVFVANLVWAGVAFSRILDVSTNIFTGTGTYTPTISFQPNNWNPEKYFSKTPTGDFSPTISALCWFAMGDMTATLNVTYNIGDSIVLYMDHTQDPEFDTTSSNRTVSITNPDGTVVTTSVSLSFREVFTALSLGNNFVNKNVKFGEKTYTVTVPIGKPGAQLVTTPSVAMSDLNGLVNYPVLLKMMETGVPTYNYLRAKLLLRYFLQVDDRIGSKADANDQFWHWVGYTYDTSDDTSDSVILNIGNGFGPRSIPLRVSAEMSNPKINGPYSGRLKMALVSQ